MDSKHEQSVRTKALDYLKAKFPAVDEKAFFTDYTGQVHDDPVKFWAVAQASDLEKTCAGCAGTCLLPEGLKAYSRPVISVARSARGYSYLDVRWMCGLGCKYERPREFERMFRKSGLKESSRRMTFEAYTDTDTETRHAHCEAMKASESGTNLILAGRPGTGKTHLATAIALRAIMHGSQAVFRLVSAMLDEIQASIRDGDYNSLMWHLKSEPCLVLDDLGHENMTAARASYLHQIIDHRYGENLQTIVTTNALTPEELCAWSGEDFIEPILSRLMERGTWVTLAASPDRRLNHD